MNNLISRAVITSIALLSFSFTSIVNAEIAVIVHPSNTSTLDATEIKKIFFGKSKSFPNGETAIPVIHAGPSSAEFYDKVIFRSASQFKSFWAKQAFSGKGTPPNKLSDDAEAKKVVSSNANIIGFIDASQVDDSVKVLLKF